MPLLLRHGWSHTDQSACESCFVGYKEFTPPRDWERCYEQLGKLNAHYLNPSHCTINGARVLNYGFLWKEQYEVVLLAIFLLLSMACGGVACWCHRRRCPRLRHILRQNVSEQEEAKPPTESTKLVP